MEETESGLRLASVWRWLLSRAVVVITMSSFYTLLSFMAVNGFEYSDPGSFDLLTNLPLELAIEILR